MKELLFILAASVATSCAGGSTGTGGEAEKAQLTRGEYLVNAIMACDSCHTPRGQNGPDFTQRFSGGDEVWDTPDYRVRGPNITMDAETGIGSWSDDDIKRMLTEGVRPDGVRVAPKMPYALYRRLTASDLDAVVSYIKTIKPVSRKSPPPQYKSADYAGPPMDADLPDQSEASDDLVSRGSYLADLAYCMACHSRRPDGVLDLKNWRGRGGFIIEGGFGSTVVSNITADREEGIGSLSDAEIKRALVEGIGHDDRKLSLPMARQYFYSQMTEQDLGAVIAWMRSLPPGR